MKLVMSAAALMVALVVVGIILQHWQERGADDMLQILSMTGEAILADRFDEAEIFLSQIEEEWRRANRLWCMVVDHDEMDRVRDSLVRLRQYIRFRDQELCMVEVAVATNLLEHIPKKEAFSLESVL